MKGVFLLAVIKLLQGCLIANMDIGRCVSTADISRQLPFCAESLPATICVPIDREVWPAYNITYRDQQVEGIFVENIEAQLILEYTQASPTLYLSNNRHCFDAYRTFLCRQNFPECDTTNSSLPLCESYCNNYYTTCGQANTECQLIYRKIVHVHCYIGFRLQELLIMARCLSIRYIPGMRILIEDLPVCFPYSLVYNEQVEYMTWLKRTLDSQGHALIEMPTGTGKTICLLALLTSYLSNRTKYKKLIYCTRTVVEMEKTLNEIKNLLHKREQDDPTAKRFLAVGLTAKKNLCVHRDVDVWRAQSSVDTECRKRTSEWVRVQHRGLQAQDEFLCPYYENFMESPPQDFHLREKHQVFGLEDLREFGRANIKCPYYAARKGVLEADIIVFNYLYLLDPKISPKFIKELSKETIVVFDEAHNIDDVCIEAYTVKVNRGLVAGAEKNLSDLRGKLSSIEGKHTAKFTEEYMNLLRTLAGRSFNQQQKPENVMQLADKSKIVPPRIIDSQRFLDSLQECLLYLKFKLKEKVITFEDTTNFLREMMMKAGLDETFFKLAFERLKIMLNMLEIAENENYQAITTITFMGELLCYPKGFKVVFQPNPMDAVLGESLITLACLDASVAMQPIWTSFPSVVLTSGTISPLEMYPKLLNFKPIVIRSIDIELSRNSIAPMIIGSTSDQTPITSEYKFRNDKSVTRNFAELLISLSDIVPDGILCFFPSYMYMEHVLKEWSDDNLIDPILDRRYIFIEKKDAMQTAEQLERYRRACDVGRGAIFLAIARGKIAEGIDFQQHYGRCVIMMGFPVQNSLDPIVLERIKFMTANGRIKDKNEFFEFDTMRQCAQCVGRVMRRKSDYGLMIFADQRFKRPGKYNKLPIWIKKCLEESNIDLTIETAIKLAGIFFRNMGKKFVMEQRLYKREEDFAAKLQQFAQRTI